MVRTVMGVPRDKMFTVYVKHFQPHVLYRVDVREPFGYGLPMHTIIFTEELLDPII